MRLPYWEMGFRDFSKSMQAATTARGSIGCATTASARDQVANQRSSTRPTKTSTGGQLKTSSLSWRHNPMPPEGVASPSRISKSNGRESTAAITAGWVAHSKISISPKSKDGRRPRLTLMLERTAESSL